MKPSMLVVRSIGLVLAAFTASVLLFGDQRITTRRLRSSAESGIHPTTIVGGDGTRVDLWEGKSQLNHRSLASANRGKLLLSATALPASTDSESYTYDALDRLISVANSLGITKYSYDSAGNRTALEISSASSALTTTVGNNVTAEANGVTTRFTTVTSGGTTSIAPLDVSSVGALPNGFQLFGGSAAFNISTTATAQGPIGVCFNGYFNTDSLTFARLRILHNENGVWVNRTTSSDFAARILCSNVSSIGQFAVVLLGPPTALIDSTSTRAAAVNSVTVLRDPVTVIDARNFSADQRTRLAFFVQSVDLLPAETLSLVTAQARDGQNVLYPLPVESVVKIPNMDWLSQVTVKLPDALVGKGDVQVTVKVRGIESSPVTVRVQ